MNTETHEKDYDYISLIKNHNELFTYDAQNDIYYCREYNMAIGNKKTLQKYIEQFCKSEDKEKVGKLFEDYSHNEILTANYHNNKKGLPLVLPLNIAFEGKNVIRRIEEQRMLRKEDKYIAGTIETQYDNYLSVEEAADLKEKVSSETDLDFDKEM